MKSTEKNRVKPTQEKPVKPAGSKPMEPEKKKKIAENWQPKELDLDRANLTISEEFKLNEKIDRIFFKGW